MVAGDAFKAPRNYSSAGSPPIPNRSGSASSRPKPARAGRSATIVGTGADDRLKADEEGGRHRRSRRQRQDLSSLAGNDVVCGGAGRDTINLGKGRDEARGEAGRTDHLIGGPGKDRLIGGGGKDVCNGGPGHDPKAAGCEVRKKLP